MHIRKVGEGKGNCRQSILELELMGKGTKNANYDYGCFCNKEAHEENENPACSVIHGINCTVYMFSEDV